MKKGTRKFFVLTVIIIGLGAAGFFAGWMQFAVPMGNYGIMLSKSGGYHREPIMPGAFMWRWERLIPTNARVLIFNLAPKKIEYAAEGKLPFSDKITMMTEQKNDFSWKWGMEVSASAEPSHLTALVKTSGAKTQADFDDYIETRVTAAAQGAVNEFIDYFMQNPEAFERTKFQYGALQKKAAEELQKRVGGEIKVHSVQLAKDFVMPDMQLYASMMQAYTNYERVKAQMYTELTTSEGRRSALSRFRMEDLKQWGELLKEYPQLIDFLAVARNDASEALRALRDLRSKDVIPVTQSSSPDASGAGAVLPPAGTQVSGSN